MYCTHLLGNLDSYAHPEKTCICHEEVFELPTYHNPGARLMVTVLREAWPTTALKNHFHFGSFSMVNMLSREFLHVIFICNRSNIAWYFTPICCESILPAVSRVTRWPIALFALLQCSKPRVGVVLYWSGELVSLWFQVIEHVQGSILLLRRAWLPTYRYRNPCVKYRRRVHPTNKSRLNVYTM